MASANAGAAYWIDHYVVPTNNLLRWDAFMEQVLGSHRHGMGGLTTAERLRGAPVRMFHSMGRYHSIGGFLQDDILPPSEGLGKGLPCYGFYVRPDDIDEHLRRLDKFDVPHTDPIATSAEGEDGTAIYFEDVDRNQYEFWAPRRMPEGAMEDDNPLGVGRVASVVQESRDLNRTADFYSHFFGLEVMRNGDLEKDVLALRFAAGGRMVFHKVAKLHSRTFGHNRWAGRHTALAVRTEEFVAVYERLWAELPESEYRPSREEAEEIEGKAPARTELHPLEARGERRNNLKRGAWIYDWDANDYHLVGGIAQDPAMAHYKIGNPAGFEHV